MDLVSGVKQNPPSRNIIQEVNWVQAPTHPGLLQNPTFWVAARAHGVGRIEAGGTTVVNGAGTTTDVADAGGTVCDPGDRRGARSERVGAGVPIVGDLGVGGGEPVVELGVCPYEGSRGRLLVSRQYTVSMRRAQHVHWSGWRDLRPPWRRERGTSW